MRYAKPTSIDTPSVGCLYQARQWKKTAWKGVSELRRKMRENPFRNAHIRLDLMKAERAHFDAQMSEKAALDAIEKRANELGLTTIKAK